MERALVRLIGSGLTSVMPGFGIAVPAGAIEGGYALVDALSRSNAPVAVALLDRLVQSLWLQWQRSGLPRDVADAHMAALPAIMDRNRPPAAMVRDALVGNHGHSQRQEGGPPPPRQLAAETIALTRQSGDIARSGLDETIAFMLLDQLYMAIAAEGSVIDAVRPFCAAYLQHGGWLQQVPAQVQPPLQARATPPPLPTHLPTQQTPMPTPLAAPQLAPQPSPVVTPPVPRQAIVARLSLAAVATLRASIEVRRKSFPDVEVAAVVLTERITKLIDRVAAAAQQSADVGAELTEAALGLASGAFGDADRAFASAEHRLMQLAQANFGAARGRMHAAATVLEHRAELEEINFRFRKAARHYRSAMRCFTKVDAARQWQYLMLQAQALLKEDEINGDTTALADAAKVCSEAGRMQPEQVGPLVWAEGENRLANFLIDLGRRERSSHRFAEAIDHARAACGVFAVERAGAGWLQSQMTLARALWLQGDLTGDQQMLGDAATVCQTARDLLTKEQAPDDWAAVSAMLGQILLRQAMATGQQSQFAEACEHLRAALRLADSAKLLLDTSLIEACLGRSLLGQFTANDQPFLLDLAATAFRRAIKAAHAKAAMADKAQLQHELGMTLWLMAERTADRISLDAALETLTLSVAAFEGIGNAQRAGEVRIDMDRLRQTNVSS